jgi:hypothetical protein
MSHRFIKCMTPNSAFLTDAFLKALRALFGAAKRGR